jgi:hypothetical protein
MRQSIEGTLRARARCEIGQVKLSILIFLLLAAVVLRSPKDAANQPRKALPLKKRVAMPPLPPPLPARASRVGKLDLGPPKTYWLVWSNTSFQDSQLVEYRTNLTQPWKQYALLLPATSNETWLKLDTTNPQCFFRVGYKWP